MVARCWFTRLKVTRQTLTRKEIPVPTALTRKIVAAAATTVTFGGLALAPVVTTAKPAATTPTTAQAQYGGGDPSFVVVGHRGASGYRPEHTLASYELAARMGADYIEPDLVVTKDKVLVARHEPEIGGTTDVAAHPEFAARKKTKMLDGIALTGWFTEDFTLAELRTLRAKERIPALRQHNTLYDGRYQVPTFQEVIDLSKRLSRELGRTVGIYPETKHPTYFQQQGLALEPLLVKALTKNGLNHRGAKVFVQSFEVSNLRAMKRDLRVPLVQLLDSLDAAPYDFVAKGDPRTYGDLVTPAGLREISSYAAGIGPWKDTVIPRDAAGRLTKPTTLVADAHRVGLKVHPYTFRAENNFVPLEYRKSTNPAEYGDLLGELDAFRKAGVDGVFSDNPDVAVAYRTEVLNPR
ncbi:glycerophosphodiester phosphodiesterase [Kribbella deserti]|uniref:glycerophosphodiester phosphodiesterase n=1 Tax=Kribbella deserti TaxID=1926257 RepID=A0ABV6QH24_9ACTN